jgi:uncharacterized protein DUF3467
MPKSTSAPRSRAPLARYANYFELGHNAFEFIIDFGQYRHDTRDVALHTRIAFGPTHAKLLTGMLARAIEAHEAEHGVVVEPDGQPDPLEVILQSLPDFEVRALNARRRATKR